MSTFITLFLEFFKTGLFAVGGGLATIPFLTEMEQTYPHWFADSKLVDIIAVAESTPGPIGINAATFCGFSAAGVPGAIVATLSLVLPSLIIITIVAKFFNRYRSSKIVNDVFTTLRPAVTGLIAAAGYSMLILAIVKNNRPDWICIGMFVLFFVLLQLKPTKKIHPFAYIACGALLGILFGL